MSDEPFTTFGQLILESGIPVRVNDTGGQGNWVRVPAPLPGDEDSVLTVQPDLSVDWEPTGGSYLTYTTTVSNATLKSTNPHTLVPAQGAGTVILPFRWAAVMRYGGNNAFTLNANMLFRYNDAAAPQYSYGPGTPFYQQTVDTIATSSLLTHAGNLSLLENQPFTLTLANALTGNAANDNVMDVTTYYVLLSV